jgi:hypothetical protein
MLSASKSSSWPIGVGDQTVIIFETLSWTLATLYRLEAYATLRRLEACATLCRREACATFGGARLGPDSRIWLGSFVCLGGRGW